MHLYLLTTPRAALSAVALVTQHLRRRLRPTIPPRTAGAIGRRAPRRLREPHDRVAKTTTLPKFASACVLPCVERVARSVLFLDDHLSVIRRNRCVCAPEPYIQAHGPSTLPRFRTESWRLRAGLGFVADPASRLPATRLPATTFSRQQDLRKNKSQTNWRMGR